MALEFNQLVKLAKATVSANPSAPVAYSFGEEKFSYEQLNETLRKELNEIAGSYSLYRENKNKVFSLMEQVFDDVLPQRVLEQYGQFAEVKTVPQGEKVVFNQRVSNASKRRAKQFVTKVGLAGVYEVFKLDGRSFEIPVTAFGGAAQISFEEFLDGRVTMADVFDIVLEGLDEAIYIEIEKALKAAATNLQAANMTSEAGFNEAAMDKLVQVADSYGQATIYCTYEFAATMIPSDGWISDAMKDQKWNNGYFANYKGHKVIVLRQSFVDDTNTRKVVDPAYAWIIPTGADKPVKIVFEGPSAVREVESNQDWSREIQTYKKLGVGTVITNNICVYMNTALAQDVEVEDEPATDDEP